MNITIFPHPKLLAMARRTRAGRKKSVQTKQNNNKKKFFACAFFVVVAQTILCAFVSGESLHVFVCMHGWPFGSQPFFHTSSALHLYTLYIIWSGVSPLMFMLNKNLFIRRSDSHKKLRLWYFFLPFSVTSMVVFVSFVAVMHSKWRFHFRQAT